MRRMPLRTSSCAPLMMSTVPSGWRMLAPRSASGAMPHDGGRASVSAGLACTPISNALAFACSTASLRSFPSRSFACVAFDACGRGSRSRERRIVALRLQVWVQDWRCHAELMGWRPGRRTLAPIRSIKSCMRFLSFSCASTVARTRACRSSRSSRNLSN
eukprot:3211377-Prymnesium_polylepis.1